MIAFLLSFAATYYVGCALGFVIAIIGFGVLAIMFGIVKVLWDAVSESLREHEGGAKMLTLLVICTVVVATVCRAW